MPDERRPCAHLLRVTLVLLVLACADSSAAPLRAPHRAPRREAHRQLFQDAMRRRDLGYWREALILFDEAGKRKAAEGERIKLYGRRRFPHYFPRFYVAEALFKLGAHAQAFAIWEEYAPHGQPAKDLPATERRLLARYRAEYGRLFLEEAATIEGEIKAARAALQSLDELTKDFSPERWRDVEARLSPNSCLHEAAPSTVSGSSRLQEIRSCLDQADAQLQSGRDVLDYAGIKKVRALVDAVVSRLFEWHGAVHPGEVVGGSMLRNGRLGDRRAMSSPIWPPAWKPYPVRIGRNRWTSMTSGPRWDVPAAGAIKPALPHPMYNERHALLIGVSDYKHASSWRNLPGVKTDIDAVEAVLGELGYKVKRAPEPADREALEKAIRGFLETAGANAENQILFYYAGHGQTVTKYGQSLGFITPREVLPYDETDVNAFMKSAVSFDFISAEVKKMEARHAFFAFDSCFSGEVFAALGASSARIAAPTRAGSGPLRGVTPVGDGAQGATDRTGELLEYFLSQPVRWFLTAGIAEQPVPDDSTFRRAFVEGLRGHVPSRRYPDLLRAEELSMFVQGEVTRVRGVHQIPDYGDAGHSHGQLFFPVPH